MSFGNQANNYSPDIDPAALKMYEMKKKEMLGL